MSEVVSEQPGTPASGDGGEPDPPKQLVSPPRTTQSRIDAVNQVRFATQNQLFIDKLRAAFNACDKDGDSQLNLDEWMESDLRQFIRDGRLSDDDFRMYFSRIDTNYDGFVTWDELVRYLIKEIASSELRLGERALNFVQKTGAGAPGFSNQHREMVRQIVICPASAEYVTLSPDSIRFWKSSDLSFRGAILEPGLFNSLVVFESTGQLAVATTNRRLLVYDYDSLQQLPTEISASPSPAVIKRMNMRDCKIALQVLKNSDLPLYNAPTCMALAEFCDHGPLKRVFFVCDDQGVLQVFRFQGPSRRHSVDVKIERISRHKIHEGAITQLSSVMVYECYATSSLDSTIKFWQYDADHGSLLVIRNIIDCIPIISFHFSNIQKILVTCGVSRDAYVWSISPPKRIFKMSGHYNTLLKVTDFVTSQDDKYIVTLTNRKEFRFWDASNYRMARELADRDMQRPENHFSAIVFDERRHALICASGVPCRYSEDTTLLENYLEKTSHNSPIIGCFYTAEFDQFVTLDSVGDFCVWNLKDGKRMYLIERDWTPKFSELSSAAMDCDGRRVVTSDFEHEVCIWNFNIGHIITKIELAGDPIMISALEYFNIGGREFLAIGDWSHTLTLYTEVSRGTFVLFRQYREHSGDVCAIAPLEEGVISGSTNGELMTWLLDTNMHQSYCKLPRGAAVECIVHVNGYAVVGDSIGYVHVYSIPRLTKLMSLKAHDVSRNHAISAMTYKNGLLITGDTLGHIKQWMISIDDSGFRMTEYLFRRCHTECINFLCITSDGRFLGTCAEDMNLRLWELGSMNYVGLYHEESSWDIEDRNTWINTMPVAFDPEPEQKEEEVARSNRSSSSSVRFSISRNLMMSATSMDVIEEEVPKEVPKVEPQEKPFDIEEVRKAFDEFLDNPITDNKAKVEREDKLMRATKRTPVGKDRTTLPTATRTPELIDKLYGILGRTTRGVRSRRSKFIRTNTKPVVTVKLPIKTLSNEEMEKQALKSARRQKYK